MEENPFDPPKDETVPDPAKGGTGETPAVPPLTLEECAARIDRKTTALWIALVGVGALAAVSFSLQKAAAPGGPLRASRLTIEQGGRKRFVVDGQALTAYGAKGEPRLRMGEQGVELLDGKGTPRIRIAVDPGGWQYLRFLDENQAVRAAMVLAPDGTPLLNFKDAQGKVLWSSYRPGRQGGGGPPADAPGPADGESAPNIPGTDPGGPPAPPGIPEKESPGSSEKDSAAPPKAPPATEGDPPPPPAPPPEGK